MSIYLNDAGVAGLNRTHEWRVIADMRNFLMAEDRLDQKLTLACRDGRSIERELHFWPVIRLARSGLPCHLDCTHCDPRSVFFRSRPTYVAMGAPHVMGYLPHSPQRSASDRRQMQQHAVCPRSINQSP